MLVFENKGDFVITPSYNIGQLASHSFSRGLRFRCSGIIVLWILIAKFKGAFGSKYSVNRER